MRKIDRIVVHCSATPPAMDVGVTEIRQWHTLPPPRGNGWNDVGYHWIIRRDGSVEVGRPETRAGAHVSGFNARSIGICLVGGVDRAGAGAKAVNNFTAEQFDALKSLLVAMMVRFPYAAVVGHRDLAPGRGCPSFEVADWLIRVGLSRRPPVLSSGRV